MPYTANVPQPTQTIAQSRPIINANFKFIPTSLQQDHYFNTGAMTEGSHKQCTMTNIADPAALPAGTNGIYYVGSGKPKFYDGTTAYFLEISQSATVITKGTVALTTSAATVFTATANSCGYCWVWRVTGSLTNAYSMESWISNGSNVLMANLDNPGIAISSSGLNLQMAVNNAANAGTYNFLVSTYTP